MSQFHGWSPQCEGVRQVSSIPAGKVWPSGFRRLCQWDPFQWWFFLTGSREKYNANERFIIYSCMSLPLHIFEAHMLISQNNYNVFDQKTTRSPQVWPPSGFNRGIIHEILNTVVFNLTEFLLVGCETINKIPKYYIFKPTLTFCYFSVRKKNSFYIRRVWSSAVISQSATLLWACVTVT